MRPIDDLSYYELLGIAPNASLSEVKHAYSRAMSIYGDDSLVTYSLFSEDQRRQILDRIEAAFAILTDANRRRAYDQELITSGRIPTEAIRPERPERVKPLFNQRRTDPATAAAAAATRLQDPEVRSHIDRIAGQPTVSGEELRQLRLALEITFDDIYLITRISRASLAAIEADDTTHLPSPIYVRNFVRGYARALGLDPDQTAGAYLAHLGMD